jgi:predicted DNA-binding protein (MmcQ/YjbR family)
MRLDRLKAFALSWPQTSVAKQWGEILVFKVAGKMFLLIPLDGDLPDGLSVKCRPEDFDDLTAIDGVVQAPYCAKRHWIRVSDLAAVSEATLREWITRSHDLVVAKLPRKVRESLV